MTGADIALPGVTIPPRALFFGPRGRRLYGVLHTPAAERLGGRSRGVGVVFSAAYGEERDTAGRVVHELGEALAADGYWVLRYHPPGDGNSACAFAECTVDDNLASLSLAVRELERRTGVPCSCLFGLRLGGTLAVRARAELGRDLPLVIWEPVPSGRRYADELLRLAMTSRMVAGGGSTSRAALRAEITGGAPVAVRGRPLTAAGLAALDAIDLSTDASVGTGPSLILQVDRRPGRKPRPTLQQLRERLAGGGDTTLMQIAAPLPWALTNAEFDVRPAALFDPTIDWLRTHVPGSPASVRSPDPRKRSRPRGRRASRGGREQTLELHLGETTIRGIVHTARVPRPDAPALLLPVMSALFPVQLARTLGERGWSSIRFDPRGKGDSDGTLPYTTIAQLHNAVQGGRLVPDLAAVADHATRVLGFPGAIPVGICGDAITSVLLSAFGRNIVGLAPLELPLLTTPQNDPHPRTSRLRRMVVDRLFATGSRRREHVRRALFRARWAQRQLWECIRRLYNHGEHAGAVRQICGRLGERANEPLVAALLRCLRRELPVLLLYGTQRMDGPSGFEHIAPLLEAAHPAGMRRLEHHLVEGADHHFSAPDHAAEVHTHVVRWLEAPGQPWNRRIPVIPADSAAQR